ncbi:hypothetical protein LCGC14_1544840 [marine sediment metagenome]|uniref:Uncharacterized protein n=1 Tax=marine sediment metagenome TaxID=412755 RepID=A0A0F9JCU7_9ZZZZ
MGRKSYFWDDAKDSYLREHYPNTLNSELAEYFGVTEKAVSKRAERLKVQKTNDIIQKARRINLKNNKEMMENKMDEEENEIVEHTVEIDDYVSVKLKIPKVMTAMDMKALMQKANKLFTLSDTPMIPIQKRQYVQRKVEDKSALIKDYDESTDKQRIKLASDMGISLKSLYQKVWALRKSLGISKPNDIGGRGNKKYSDGFVDKAVKKLKSGISTANVADRMGLNNTKKLYDLVYGRTGKTPKQLRNGG